MNPTPAGGRDVPCAPASTLPLTINTLHAELGLLSAAIGRIRGRVLHERGARKSLGQHGREADAETVANDEHVLARVRPG